MNHTERQGTSCWKTAVLLLAAIVPSSPAAISTAALNKPLVLVLANGSALAVNWARDHVPAVVEAWYPGQAGGTALADVLFGDYNLAGRLPVTFYRSEKQLPDLSGLIRVADTSSARRSDMCGAGRVPCPRFRPGATTRETSTN